MDPMVLADVGDLRPVRVVDESPRGRLVGIEFDEWWTYVELHALLVGDQTEADPAESVAQAQDLAGRLVELQERADSAWWAVLAHAWGH